MRFKFDFKPTAQGWDLTVLDAAGQPLTMADGPAPLVRKLQKLETGGTVFPLPPADEPTDQESPEVRDLCRADVAANKLSLAYRNFLGKSPGLAGVRHLGRYLFLCLLGDALWQRLDAASQAEPLELAINWNSTGDAKLHQAIHRLPWEICHGPQRFLAEEVQLAITRCVTSEAKAGDGKALLNSLNSPPRVLFVVGADLNLDVIRPGAEYLGLLRSIRANNLQLKTHLLLQASTNRLKEAVAWFKPDVVHFICHGGCESDGQGFLNLADHDAPFKPTKAYAGALITALRGDERGTTLPPVVVLNACYTAQTDAQGVLSNPNLETAGPVANPLALRLVREGVPVVIGMAGQVSDTACRLFTRRFYETLLVGGDAAQATAAARRSGILGDGVVRPESNVDWGMPTLFVAEQVGEPRFTIKINRVEADWQALANNWTFKYPCFCGRLQLLNEYDLLLTDDEVQSKIAPAGKGPQVIAIRSLQADDESSDSNKQQFGRTWVLKAMAAKAALDGHVPCLVTTEEVGDALRFSLTEANSLGWPLSFSQLVMAVMAAANKTKSRFNLKKWKWKFLPRLKAMESQKPVPSTLPAHFPDKEFHDAYELSGNPSAPLFIAAALRWDLLSLLKALRKRKPRPERNRVKLVLLIDDVHKMGEAATSLLDILLGFMGFRAARDSIRVVLAYSAKPKSGQEMAVNKLKEWFEKTEWAHTFDLTAFQPAEERLVYQQFLASWREDNCHTKDVKPLAFNPLAAPGSISFLLASLNRASGRIPSWLVNDKVTDIINGILQDWPPETKSPLRLADDNELLKTTLASRLKGPKGATGGST